MRLGGGISHSLASTAPEITVVDISSVRRSSMLGVAQVAPERQTSILEELPRPAWRQF